MCRLFSETDCRWRCKAGIVHDQTCDFAYDIVNGGVHINDLNTTVFNQLGIDHNKFTYKHQGLDDKLTGVEGARIVKEILNNKKTKKYTQLVKKYIFKCVPPDTNFNYEDILK